MVDDTDVSAWWPPYAYLHDFDVPDAVVGQHNFELVSGTVRDGVWETRVMIPRGFPASDLAAAVHVIDAAGHPADLQSEPLVHVRDDAPDRDWPVVTQLSPRSASTFDLRTDGRALVARARITDRDTGVAPPVTISASSNPTSRP